MTSELTMSQRNAALGCETEGEKARKKKLRVGLRKGRENPLLLGLSLSPWRKRKKKRRRRPWIKYAYTCMK